VSISVNSWLLSLPSTEMARRSSQKFLTTNGHEWTLRRRTGITDASYSSIRVIRAIATIGTLRSLPHFYPKRKRPAGISSGAL
jgi:hypothetical protein